MAVQSIASEDLFEGLPSLVGLPRCVPKRPSYRRTPFREVCVPEELPPYLLLGHVDRSAFRSTDDGWSARWNGDTPETFVEAQYERATKQLQLRQVWRGIDGGVSFTTGDDAGHGIRLLYLPFPETWDEGLAQRLESAYRLKYLPGRDQYGFTGIPDGGFKTIGVPVPIHKLADVRACLEDLARDPELRVPMGGRLDLRFGTVNHVTGRGPAWTEDPERLYAASFEANGLLPLGLPQLERAEGGVGRMMEALEQSAEEAAELIRQAVLVSARQRRWLASLMRCEECEA